MQVIDLRDDTEPEAGITRASLLLEHGRMKVRRIDLAAGAKIPPCRMQEDAVFVVLSGRVTFRSEGREAALEAGEALFIPGGAAERSMEAHRVSRVLGVLSLGNGAGGETGERMGKP